MRQSAKPRPDHARTRKSQQGWRRKGILWDYNGDGRWPERIKGPDKRYWKRWSRRQQHRGSLRSQNSTSG